MTHLVLPVRPKMPAAAAGLCLLVSELTLAIASPDWRDAVPQEASTCVIRIAWSEPHPIRPPQVPVLEQGSTTLGQSCGDLIAAPRSPLGKHIRTASVDRGVYPALPRGRR